MSEFGWRSTACACYLPGRGPLIFTTADPSLSALSCGAFSSPRVLRLLIHVCPGGARRYGWKQVHGDVFRPPRNPVLLASFIGTGMQLAVVGLCVIFISIWGDLWEGCALPFAACWQG